MEEFGYVIDEYNRYMVGTLIGKKIDLKKLRSLCDEFNKKVPDKFKINTDAKDEEFLSYLKILMDYGIKKSEKDDEYSS